VGWRAERACRDVLVDLFFPVGSSQRYREQIELGRSICAGCPVRRECLDYAETERLDEGTYGGVTQWERLRMRQRRAASVSRQGGVHSDLMGA
jgi:WhiB family redox-sensing transcriptional regulator